MITSEILKPVRSKLSVGVIFYLFFLSPVFFLATASADSVTSPLDSDNPNESNNGSNPQIDPNYDPCATTAYGESLYVNNGPIGVLSKAEMEAQYQRARMAFLFGNYGYALKIFEPLAFQGYAKAEETLAWMFHTGKGVHKNMKRALAWYRAAASNNKPIAQNNLGVFYEQGIEVRQSYKKAAKWYKEAAEVGYSYAQYNLGVLYLKGKGVKKDHDKAIYWLQIASLQGVKEATALLKKLGKQSAPHDKNHQIKPRKKYHHHSGRLSTTAPAITERHKK
jgi:hypothetical protein